jgi:hypothetical protein
LEVTDQRDSTVSGVDEPEEQVGGLAIEIGTSVQEEASVSVASGQVAEAP